MKADDESKPVIVLKRLFVYSCMTGVRESWDVYQGCINIYCSKVLRVPRNVYHYATTALDAVAPILEYEEKKHMFVLVVKQIIKGTLQLVICFKIRILS